MAEIKICSGKFVDDPVESLEIGSSMSFASLRLDFGDEKILLSWIEHWECFKGTLLAVSFSEDGKYKIEGSAVLVGPGIAISAKHLFEDKMSLLLETKKSALFFAINSNKLEIWVLTQITLVANSDLCILGLKPKYQISPNQLLNYAAISTRLPRLNERMTICGFRADHREYVENFNQQTLIQNPNLNILISSGTVSERYPYGRDKIMLPGPCLEILSSSIGCMSGGPVYDKEGKLVGIISTSFDNEDMSPTYVSLLWPALAANFYYTWPTLLSSDFTRLIDNKSCDFDKRDCLKYNEVTGITEMRIWE